MEEGYPYWWGLVMFNHPFVGDLSTKSVDELLDTISRLSNQQQYMFRTGKHTIVSQINMVLSSYREEYNRRQGELWNKKTPHNMDKKIDIS
jgi:hypothetical protein